MTNTEEQTKNVGAAKRDFLLPVSIVIAAVLIGGAVVWSTMKNTGTQNAQNAAPAGQQDPVKLADNVKPVSDADHSLGNKNAEVKIMTFTDFECPFCKQYHPVLKQALATYGDKIEVIYRNYPLPFHQYAENEAEAAECVASIGGNQRYWDYADKIFEQTTSNGTGLDPKYLTQFAKDLGLDMTKFNQCLSGHQFAGAIQDEIKDGNAAGVGGTPYSIVISKSGKKYIIPGAYPFENPQDPNTSVKAIIDEALKNG